MIISSIDLKGGKVVQLKNGRDLVLQRDDAEALLADFDRYGETAVIDLDAALGKVQPPNVQGIPSGGNGVDTGGATANTALLQSLLRKGNVRVGGGVRDVKRAKELVSLGAEKVIVGSAAFNTAGLNTAFLTDLVAAIGKQRIIIAVDSRSGFIAVKGWTETTAIPLLEGSRKAQNYAGELLFTSIEKEGCMEGTDMAAVKRLRDAVDCRLTAAGGVASLEEVAALAKMDVDVQLGMAIYTGKVKLDEGFTACLNWAKTPLIPVVAQSTSGEVLMVGFANEAALAKTFASGFLTFWSRSRNILWTKGETSGNTLKLVRIRADCDRDTILATVIPAGPVCHRGSWTCFGSKAEGPYTLESLYGIIADRFANPAPGSYTATLDDVRVREKVLEEAGELTEAAGAAEITWECADLLYFLSVLMYREKVTWADVAAELDRRHKK